MRHRGRTRPPSSTFSTGSEPIPIVRVTLLHHDSRLGQRPGEPRSLRRIHGGLHLIAGVGGSDRDTWLLLYSDINSKY